MMRNLQNPLIGAFLLRITLGSVLLAHSVYLKLMVFTLSGTANFFVSIGLPETLAYTVFAVEAVAGVMLILGIKTHIFSAMAIPVLLGATWVHSSNGWLFTNNGGGWEYPLILAIMALVQICLGDGEFSATKKINKYYAAVFS